jgi:hypothetical protein
MKQVLTILEHLCELAIFCGVLFIMIEATDDSSSSPSMRGPIAQAAQPARDEELATPKTAFSPLQYENQAKEIEELPPQF